MKITQGQYFEIEEFFTDKCRLVEEGFIQEMVDHFIDGIEMRMTETVSFEAAFGQTIDEFGGVRSIRKMEWGFQKSLARKLAREWWMAVREYAHRPKLYLSVTIFIVISALVAWSQLDNRIHLENLLPGFISGFVLIPLCIISLFVLQRYSKWVRSLGPVNTKALVYRTAPLAIIAISIFLFSVIIKFFPAGLLQTIICSTQLSISMVVYVASFGHFNREELESWYRPKLSK